MSYFDKAVDRSNTNALKYDKPEIKAICGNPDALPYWVADMDLPTSPVIKQALQRETDLAVPGYAGHSAMLPEVREFVRVKHGWDVTKDQVVYAQGMLHAIALAMNLFTKEGDEILLPYPCYQPFVHMIEDNERIIRRFDLTCSEGMFTFDREEFAKRSEGCTAILFCSPHNPSGVVFSEGDLKYILTLAKERGQLVLSDEIHSDLVHPSFHHYPMGLVNEQIQARCITFMAPSKTFNIAGEHCAFAIFNDVKMKLEYQKAQKRLFLAGEGYFAGALAEAVYSSENYQFLTDMNAYLESNADYVRNYLRENVPGIRMANAGASFITFLDCSEIYEKILKDKEAHPEFYEGDYNIISHFFGNRAGICVNDGSWFGKGYEKFVRFNYGTSRELVVKAMELIKSAVDAL
ncbi:MAG: aminotransferase class I/II-fold pyridoxal phosphate-dependent enzyme [Spirochaetales bacterium]|nr:aminotransferase class I/II-fold pyridoxal phosphate-dependent enzyme [Spirochaetales bacterium]MDY5908940.1 aminotransferase class I/II-fold pyridoxal phosphate-dependent enzyme [Bullifex sp.]